MNYKRLSISIFLCQLVGWMGAIFTAEAIPNWYETLEKPFFSPPNWVFGPVWTLLYLMMGISVYLIWQRIEENKAAKTAFVLFWIHLAFNASWSLVFFNLKNLALALINILIIWSLIIILMIKFWNIDRRSSYLLIPYLFWVTFATALNYSIWMLN